ncbi:CaiB/BaiF CoA-transferase family protein [Streptomyces sp. CB03238]|uniref:CaiB/BaiF CoA transferase family protein n=1 Tax=Streptomyces sp. CB03238 TaxID=1907777 RepID=UPI000A112008|nr:CaiB/BaiF CoA-transferase family protein [Streptomyces sp. CB03238]ORT56540.1 carnitine dehydratase [Streptomyces sp. CB03238]
MGGPLRGVRVVELTGIGPAPFACMFLADLGADVVRVDRTDGVRPYADEHRVFDRGRRSVALDLKDRRGVDALLRLTARADVLVEGYRPGVAERLGIGPEDCRAGNPGLVYARMTGWGQDGPLAQAPGHDINYLALSGGLAAIGRGEGPPAVPLNVIGDFAGGGLLLVAGVLAALLERGRSGRGQVVDAAITDGTAALFGMLMSMTASGNWRPRLAGNLLDGGAPYYDVYTCADGRYMAVGAMEEPFYRELLAGLGLAPESLPDRADAANWPALRTLFAERFASRTRDEWAALFDGTQACATPVLDVTEAAAHPHHRERGTYVTGDGRLQPAPAPRFSATPPRLPDPAPRPGGHTEEVLFECGLTPADVRQLIADGVAMSPATTTR